MSGAAQPIHAIVVGGGITGLAAAYRLNNRLSILGRPFKVTLLEAGERFGGPIQTLHQGPFLLEAGPDAFLSVKPAALTLIQELGLSHELLETRPDHRHSYIVWNKKLFRIPEGFYMLAPTQLESVLTTRLLSLQGKWRLLREPFVPLRPQEDESLGSFVRRRLGPEVLERLAQPLVAGIYAADPDTLSLRATFPQFLEMEAKGGLLRNMGRLYGKTPQTSGARYSLFVTLKNGLQHWVDRLAERLGPSVLQPQTLVQALACTGEPGHRRWQLHLASGPTLESELLCLAVPAYAAARLLSTVDPALSQRLAGIPYTDSLTAHWGFPASQLAQEPQAAAMKGIGFVIPQSQKHLLGAATFVHHKFSGRAPQDQVLIRGFAGGHSLAAQGAKPDDQLLHTLWNDLRQIVPISGAPSVAMLHRHRQAMPQYRVGHLDLVRQIDEAVGRLDGLALAGSWRWGIGIPDCIDSGQRAAEALINYCCVATGLGTKNA